jgi:hypothetical protein
MCKKWLKSDEAGRPAYVMERQVKGGSKVSLTEGLQLRDHRRSQRPVVSLVIRLCHKGWGVRGKEGSKTLLRRAGEGYHHGNSLAILVLTPPERGGL